MTYYDAGNTTLNNGTFNNTLWNSSGQFVHLNFTDNTNTTYVQNGTYTSQVIDLNQTSLFLNITWKGRPGTCPANMTYIDHLVGPNSTIPNTTGYGLGFCIDNFEASIAGCEAIGSNCGDSASSGYCFKCNPTSEVFGSASSDTGTTVVALSRSGVAPIAQASQQQARQACQNAGKRLCTSPEWLAAANVKGKIWNLPTGASGAYIPNGDSSTTTNCNTNSFCSLNASQTSNRACLTGSLTDCVSAEGVYDQVGNVWEWTNETVTSVAPSPGTAGWYYPSDSGWQTSGSARYGNDGVYFPAGTNTGRAVLRGCRWSFGASAGPFCAALSYAPSYVDPHIGFRCCRSSQS